MSRRTAHTDGAGAAILYGRGGRGVADTLEVEEMEMRLVAAAIERSTLPAATVRTERTWSCLGKVLQVCGLQHATRPMWAVTCAAEKRLLRDRGAAFRPIRLADLPPPRSLRRLTQMEAAEQRTSQDDLMEAMAFLQDLHRSTAEDAWPERRLLTDCVFALDVCGLLVAPQYRVEAAMGLLGPL